MEKKKLELGVLEIRSFVTTLNKGKQNTVNAGIEISDRTRILSCPTNQDPIRCGSTDGDECERMITNNERQCDDLLN